jgi:ABC-2 type transport system ATP-binding protein
MGFVLDQPLYFDRLTCREFLGFVGVMYDLPKADVNNRVEELIRFFDLTEAADRFIETYSKGMKQKVSLAAAILHEPVLLVLDEPFDGIDAASAEEIRQLLLRMNRKGVTILITSHILEFIESLCTECAILHKGRVVFQSRMDELEMQLQRSGDNEQRTSLRDIFLQVTSADRPHKSLSWLS